MRLKEIPTDEIQSCSHCNKKFDLADEGYHLQTLSECQNCSGKAINKIPVTEDIYLCMKCYFESDYPDADEIKGYAEWNSEN